MLVNDILECDVLINGTLECGLLVNDTLECGVLVMTKWNVVCWLITHATSVHKSDQATIIRATTFR